MMTAPPDSWAVALYEGATSLGPRGAGVVVDHSLVLACAHVVFDDGVMCDDLWVSFPRADHVAPSERRRVLRCLYNGMPEHHLDLVLLELDKPVPASVHPARLRLTPGQALSGHGWWAYGFPDHIDGGHAAYGTVSGPGGFGRVHLTAHSSPGVAKGFSGTALWSPDYQAVVGIVVMAETATGSGQALTLAYADEHLPEMKLSTLDIWRVRDADEGALAAWGWTLAGDGEARLHWLPRARGVAAGVEAGTRFRGRSAALRHLQAWLDRDQPSGRPMIVTGSPGVGKSAVLGRIVTTADPEINAALPAEDLAERATVGSVACAVHAKGKAALEVAEEIARAVGVSLPLATVDLMPALRDRLTLRPRRFNLVVDALDETATPHEARTLVDDVLVPLARTCGHLGVQVIVGTRRSDDVGDLLGTFGADSVIIDLDAPEYFSQEDLAGYAQATLQHTGSDRPDNPYADPLVAQPVAARIAALAGRNFLIAGLEARARAMWDIQPIDPANVSFTATVADALRGYVSGLPNAGNASALTILTALAYAETPGLSIPVWHIAVQSLGGALSAEQLAEFARSSAANFLIETGNLDSPTYRLFHQALNDTLLSNRREVGASTADEQRLVRAWLMLGRATGWASAPDYLLRSLPQHAARALAIDELLNDDLYLLHAQLDRLLPVADTATTDSAKARAHLLQRTPLAVDAPAPERAALFSVVDQLDNLGACVSVDDAPYEAAWAHTPRRLERTVLEGHSLAVYDVCAITVDGRSLLASGGEDGTVRMWDPLTNQTVRVLSCHDECVRSVSSVQVGDQILLATASHDGTVCLWDPRSELRVHTFAGHGDWVRNICAVPMPGGDLLVSASDDRTVRVWDVAAQSPLHMLVGHTGWVTAVTYVPDGPYGLIASAGFDGTVRLWDPLTGQRGITLRGHVGWVATLCAARYETTTVLASGGYDGTVRIWNPLTGAPVAVLDSGRGPITDLCTVEVDGECLLASTDEEGTIQLWDIAEHNQRMLLQGHASWIRAMCELPLTDHHVLATAGDDGTVRLWDPASGQREPMADPGQPGRVTAVCAVPGDDRWLVASAGSDGSVRLWDARSGNPEPEGVLTTNGSPVKAICVVEDDRLLLAAAGEDRTVHLWDLYDREPAVEMRDHLESVNAVCVLRSDDGLIMASAGDDETVRLWKPQTATPREGLVGHRNWVTSLAVVNRQGRQMLASADKNGTLRLWDSDGSPIWEQHGHSDAINALCALPLDGRNVVVSAGADRTIRVWDTVEGRPTAVLAGHTDEVTGLTSIVIKERQILVSTSLDRTVRLWDPRTGRLLRSIPVHHRAMACCEIDNLLVIGLDHGMLALAIRRP